MPIQLLCTSVVIRNDAIVRLLSEENQDFASIAPNNMSYGDDNLSQASFMSPVDAEEFCKSLELRGFQRDDDDPDFVVVCQHDQSITPTCQWLRLFEWEDRLIGTLEGCTSRTVIGPEKPLGNSIRHYSNEEIAEKFEFVSRENNIDTYRNKETGDLVYHTRKTLTDDEIFKSAFSIVWDHKREIGHSATTGEAADKVKTAIESLQKVAARRSDSPRVFLALGIAWYSIGHAENGIRLLRKAIELDSEEPMYCKELAGILLCESQLEEALEISRRAVVIRPDDPELLGNLGVTELLNGLPHRAAVTLEKALQFEPNDKINQTLKRVTSDIISGKRRQPKSLRELMSNPKKPIKKSFWSRWFGK